MQNKKRVMIGMIVLGMLIALLTAGVWILESTRSARREALAREALESGDWEKAAQYAEEADAETLRLEAIYQAAETAYNSGDYETARQTYASLGAYKDSAARTQASAYASAKALEAAGEDAAAREAYFALIPYEDAAERYRACSYREAERIYAAGETQKAFLAYVELIPYADTEERALAIATELTGETDPQKAMAFAKGYSETEWAQIEEVRKAREALKHGRIAVGHGHAAVLYADGHVAAFGDNGSGQCDVTAFQNITAVAAGFSHTLGLKTDGTVIAAGDNTYGQCDVASWTDVVSIACGAWDSFGICSDGSLLHCGFSTYDLSGWSELQFVCACETALIGLRTDGSLLCTAADGRFAGSSYCSACITTGAAFALTDEGTVRCEQESVAAWTDLVAITNSASVLVGIRADGSLTVHPLIPCRAAYLTDLASETNVAEVAPGGSFALILHRDGTVSGCGDLPDALAEFLQCEPVL